MKRVRACLVLLLVMIIITGACGCMFEQNDEVVMSNMKKYAVDKYGCEFTVVNFQAAKDETYTNILTLDDGEVVFNVYNSEKSEFSDDYPKAIVNKKLNTYLDSKNNSDLDVFANFMISKGNEITFDYAKEKDSTAILSDYSLLKVVVIVKINGEITNYQDELFDIYKEIISLEPKYIDFQMIQAESVGSELNDMLNNLPALYDNAWDRFPEIKAHLSVSSTDVASASELIKGGK